MKYVQARLKALSVIIYSNQLTRLDPGIMAKYVIIFPDSPKRCFLIQSLLYSGLLEELVDVLEMRGDHLMEIKALK